MTSSDDDDDDEDRKRGRRGFGDDDDDDDDEDGDGDGWFRRGMGRFSWSLGFGGLRKASRLQQQQQEEEEEEEEETYPSRGEMELNFEEEHGDVTPESGRSSEVYYDAEDDLRDENQLDGEGEEEEPLYPGTYRAMYAFDPEGTAEMRLTEDQIVHVVGRGGGVGWAVAVVPEGVDGGVDVGDGIRHALVPESYLELVELD